MQDHKTRYAFAVLGLTMLLQACGGGGGGGDGEEAHTTSSTAASPAADAPAAPQPPAAQDTGHAEATDPEVPEATAQAATAGTAAGCGLPDFQAEAMRLLNARRAAGASCGARGRFAAAPALRWNSPLTAAAYRHSSDMARRDFFSHTGSDGSTLGSRVTAAGYAWSGVAENIAAGQRSVRSVVDGWMASPGHCANIMSATYRDVGLACVRNAGSRYGTYWTLDLARPR